MARPPYEPNDQDRKTVRAMTAYGITQDQIIAVLGITRPTLRKYFRKELATAAIEANAQVAGSLFHKARAGDTISMIFWLKVRAGWKEPPQEVGGIDGSPIAVEYSWADPPAPKPAAPE
jgi:transcriptional regulator with XRE-family HTH domain